MKSKISFITPSYNEFKNISLLVSRIRKVLPKSKIIIVDDSPKQYNSKIRALFKKKKNIIVISRFIKLGRGSAVIRGFKYAVRDKNLEFFFEIDSDLAHNPIEIPRFLDKMAIGEYDVVIGSRYVNGGRTINIVLYRIILSRIINLFLRFWLNIKINDFTGGFRMYNRKTIEYLCKSEIRSNGFITLSETLYLLHKKGFRIAEVPVTVSIKKEGKSNVDAKELFRSLFFVLFMKFSRY